MAKKSQAQKDAEEALKYLKEEAELRERMNSGYDEYIKAVKEAHRLQKTITENAKIESDINKKLADHQAGINVLTQDQLDAENEKLKIIQEQNKALGKQVEVYKSAAKEANVAAMSFGKATAGLVKGIEKGFNLVQDGFGKIKGLGLFDFDKAIKQSALSMGVLSKEGGFYRKQIKDVALETTKMGVNLKALTELQSSYSENLGRTVLLSKEGLQGLADMSKMTGLGAEGASQMAADMELQGLSAERTAGFVNKTLGDASKMGLNATKVMKNVAGNIKLMDKYRFKAGTKGLAEMAKLVTKLGVDMKSVSGMADKLWNIEGAVEMSAQLNVMGGAWAQMADPFHLMYMARNDMKGLTEEIANAAQQSVFFNDQTKEFDITAEGMHKLKILAEQTGVAYEDLVTMGKNMKKFNKIKSEIGFAVTGSQEDKDMLEYVSSKAYLDKNGKAKIMIGGEPKLVSQLNEGDKQLIKTQIAQQEDMRERAMQARTFDEQLDNFKDILKVKLLPIIEKLSDPNGGLMVALDKFTDKVINGDLGKYITKFAEGVGDFVNTVGKFIVENPVLVGSLWAFSKAVPLVVGAFKLFGGIWDTIKWFKNGIALSQGFLAGSGGSGPGGGSGPSPSGGGGYGKNFRNNYKGLRTMGDTRLGALKSAFKWGGGTKGLIKGIGGRALGVAGLGLDAYSSYQANKEAGIGTGENIAKTATSTTTKGLGAWGGGLAGAKLGTMIGAFGGPLGMAIGAGLGGLIGGIGGYMAGGAAGDGINSLWGSDVEDGEFKGVASSVRKGAISSIKTVAKPKIGKRDNNELLNEVLKTRGIIDGGKIHRVADADTLWAAKPGGEFSKNQQTSPSSTAPSSIKHEFGNITINGTIRIESPGGTIKDNLLNDESFKREITKVVKEESIKQLNYNKLRG